MIRLLERLTVGWRHSLYPLLRLNYRRSAKQLGFAALASALVTLFLAAYTSHPQVFARHVHLSIQHLANVTNDRLIRKFGFHAFGLGADTSELALAEAEGKWKRPGTRPRVVQGSTCSHRVDGGRFKGLSTGSCQASPLRDEYGFQ